MVVVLRPDRQRVAAQAKFARHPDRQGTAAVAPRPDRQGRAPEAEAPRPHLLAAVAPDRAMAQRAGVQRAQAQVRHRLRPQGRAPRRLQMAR